ncbi:MAG: type II secretion system protein [Planctomycetota bacterium]|jgi:type II secretory pathway pseudopilin PulG
MSKNSARAFTIVELLVVVSIIALLIGILLPAIGKARDQARLSISQSNLRNLASAHGVYGGEWNDRQFTLIDDNISRYGNSPSAAIDTYQNALGTEHPVIFLGWGTRFSSGAYANWILGSTGLSAYLPITFVSADSVTGGEYFGSFRLINVQAFHNYVGGRFYDTVFYAPKDQMVMEHVKPGLESPEEYTPREALGQRIGWSSYCLSPAAMFSPDVMRSPDEGGWQDPWSLVAGFRSPAFSQTRYPDLKTHMLEHHWLQQRRADCNPAFDSGTYEDCEPYYFNHSWESVPVTLFYDGHVAGLGVREAESADSRQQVQAGAGLWSRDTSIGSTGYFIDIGYDFANTSFHILTTDGIRGRDTLGR